MHKPPDYDRIEQGMWRTNAESVQNTVSEAEASYIARKVKTYVWRFGHSEAEVMKKIKQDRMFANVFAKEPRRTGFHEAVAADWIKNLGMVSDFEVMKKTGGSAAYVNRDGNVQTGKRSPDTKSLDFKWKTGKYECYATHKFTKEGGGNQDNQHKEVNDTLGRFQKGGADRNVVLFVILDGPYYNEKRMERSRSLARKVEPLSFVLPIQCLPDVLNELKSHE